MGPSKTTHRVQAAITLLIATTSLPSVRAGQSELLDAISLLDDHIHGVASLTVSEINTQAGVIHSNRGHAGDNATMLNAGFGLVGSYETIEGPLFVNGDTRGGFSRTDTSTSWRALAHAMLNMQQALIEDGYTAWNLNNHRGALDGAMFQTSSYFPGAVSPPADSNAVYSVQINASQPAAWGFPVMYMEEPARRPTGAYLAPGSVATVTVPATLVNKGFQIRVGAHVHDLSAKGTIKRIDRVSVVYDITAAETLVANPLGGGIYLEVPYEANAGLVVIDLKNTVRAPFYSNTSARQTTLSEWQTTERHHPGPWTDFETDKTMFNLPTGWIYNYADPVTLMQEWDDAMDAVSDLVGLPQVRPKTVLYAQIDVLIRSGAYAPGYPQSNHTYNPNAAVNGSQDNDYLNGPKFAPHHHLHELGHACLITKFTGETEATVNLLYVPVHHRKFGVSLDAAFGRSMGNYPCRNVSRDQAALLWILSDKFRAGQPQAATDMKYQHRGYGKYVEIAGLFGWDALGSFWHSVAVDYENGITYPTNSDPTDSRIVRMSRAAGADLTPLIHFWGVHPNTPAWIESTLVSEGIGKSPLIYDRLMHYQTVVPMTVGAFESHYQKVKDAPIDSDFFDTMRTGWNATLGSNSVSRVQEIIDLYFPYGRPAEGIVQSIPYAESFEKGIGEWTQVLTDDYDWSLNSGDTPTAGTGPSGASDGNQYLYAEGHDAGDASRSTAVECTFDLSTTPGATLYFDYHMCGPYIESLAVDIHDGRSWMSNAWVRVGAQHAESTSAWSSVTLDLSAYGGSRPVTVRFRAQKRQWHASDVAIDNIRVDLPPSIVFYEESFERGLGAWTQLTYDDYDWTLNSGGTPTSETGPSGASDGVQYLYAEGHDAGGAHKVTMLASTFDLSTVRNAIMTFDYHMYGPYIDYLAVDVHAGASWASNVWSRSGAQHESSGDAWSRAVVDLSAYAGNASVTVRFRAKKRYWHASDTAIDDVRIRELADPLYLQWAAEAFAESPPGTDQTTGGNPDGDQLSNELEWALVTDPTVPDRPWMDIFISDPNVVVRYDRRPVDGISVRTSWATSLTSTVWRLDGDGMTETTLGWDDDIENRAVYLPLDTDLKFIRLEVAR